MLWNLANWSIQQDFGGKQDANDWRRYTVVLIYKSEGDVQDYYNYREIKLMSHIMKLWEKVIKIHIRRCTSILENQFEFIPERSTMETVYIIRKVIEYYRARKTDYTWFYWLGKSMQ